MKLQRLLSLAMALLLVSQVPLVALALEVDLYYGDVTITDTQVTHSTADEQNITSDHEGTVTVKQSNSETTTSNTIDVITTEKDLTVVLDNVNVALQSGNIAQDNPMDVEAADGTTVTIELNGENKLDASTGSFNNNASAGLHKDESGSLVIQDSDNDGGSLTAIGNVYAAGIGSDYSYSGEKTADITIESGTIYAESKSPYSYQHSSGAGIGAGTNGAADKITINGGTVTAVGDMGAAIGGGSNGAGSNIAINGGTVTATSDSGAAIGGGSKGAGSNIVIEEATVTATSVSGAAIGGGSNGAGTDILIEEATVTTTSTSGAGIGGGSNGAGTGITLVDSAVASTSTTGAGIGSGAGTMHFDVPLEVTINGGDVTATSTDGAGIGGGKNGSYYGNTENRIIDVEITDATVNATSTSGAAIGVGNGFSKPTTVKVSISGDADVTGTSTDNYAFGTDKAGNVIIPDTAELNEGKVVTANQQGETITYPLPEPEPEPKPELEPEAEPEYTPVYTPVAAPSQIKVNIDNKNEIVIDLVSGTQDGQPMEKIEVEAAAIPENATIEIYTVAITAEESVDEVPKENVAMVFAVSCMQGNVEINLSGTVQLSIPAPEFDLDGYVLVFVNADGEQIEIPYELVDGKLVFETEFVGLYMIIKK